MEDNRTGSGLRPGNDGREVALFGDVEWGLKELDGRMILTAVVDGVLYYENAGLCAVLEHSNPSKALADFTDPTQRIMLDVRGANSLTGREGIRRGNPNRAFVTREGGNRLLMKSRAPGADSVHRWLADDVMPSIEDTGGYTVPRQAPNLDLVSLDELERLNTAFGKAIEMARAATARAEIAEARNAELEPAAAQAEVYAEADSLTTKRAFARDVQQWYTPRGIKVTQQQVFDFLGHIGLISRIAGSEHDQATATAVKDGRAKNSTKNVKMPDGTIIKVKYGKLTGKGEKYAWKRIWAAIGEHNTLDLDVIRGAVVPADPKVIRP